MRRAARAWRARERRRLAGARREWLILHRQALAINDRRWRAKFDRLKCRARNVSWHVEYWRRQTGRIATKLMSYDRRAKNAFQERGDSTPSPAHGGIMAMALLVLGVSYSLTEIQSTPYGVTVSGATPAQAATQRELASLPRDHSAGHRAVTSHTSVGTAADGLNGYRSTGTRRQLSHSNRVDSVSSRGMRREGQPIQRLQDPRASGNAATSGAEPASAPSDDQMTDAMLRERLERSIRNLRAGQTTY
jgi:hypothetical protein